ncbi:MAG: NAD(P)/FAD-dependent oxidoreductase [Acidocella sp.]|nr:NAD(P)/FAD-dependent oxidoreductase [Acidocella sp.]
MRHYDVAVIGAGAAGLFCAATAAKRGKRVLVLEHGAEPGAKILISGGGRCNFTNLDVKPQNFISNNPHFCKSALAGYSNHDFIELVQAHGIAFHEKRLGQLFCDRSAKDILNMLLDLCRAGGVDLRLSHQITGITKPDQFHITTNQGPFTAASVVMATGGLSIPKMGATGFTYEIARQFGLGLTEIRAGLVPLLFEGPQWAWMQGLSGVAFEAVAACGKAAFAEAALFTHRGLSGPAILQISSYWKPGETIRLDMLPGRDAYEFLLERKVARPRAELKTILGELLPVRLAHNLLQPPLGNHTIGDMPNKALKNTAEAINGFALHPSGTEGYAKAEVTIGGVDTSELSSKTMEARKVPGLYVIGEAVDVTGWLGGYNFQWAWSSGFAAGRAA